MSETKLVVGQVFNNWTLISLEPQAKGKYYALFQCSCGKEKVVYCSNVVKGKSLSCGCLQKKVMSLKKGTKMINHKKKSFEDLSGKMFHNLRVLSKFEWFVGCARRNTRSWICACSCGTFVVLMEDKLKRNISCGCYSGNETHGASNTKEYRGYYAMLQRCYNENNSKFYLYGGNGVEVCDRWLEPNGRGFLNFLEDMGERPEGKTLNRVNGAKIYSKETCEWATYSMQSFDRKSLPSKSGHTGITYIRGKYCATIGYQGEVISLGNFDKIQDALDARRSAEIKYYGRVRKTE